MTVVGSPFFLMTISSSFATPLSDAQSSQDQSYRNRARPRDGGGDERMRSPRHCNSGQGSFRPLT